MECRKVLTEDNATLTLFVLDAHGILEPGNFVLIAYSNSQRAVALTKGGISRILSMFDYFDKVEIKFKCDVELADILGAQVLYARP